MNREQIIAALMRHKREIRARGAKSLFLFGSVLRGEDRPGSDVDLFIDYYPNRKFSLVDLVGLKHYLRNVLGRDVDLLTRGGLHRLIRSRVEAEAVRVF
jgi:hypothetical protein